MAVPVGVALAGALGAVASTSAAALAAELSSGPTGSNGVITITSAGATSAAVGALVWVVRAMLSGKLVPRSTEALEEKLIEITQKQSDVIAEQARRIAEDQKREEQRALEARTREDRFYALVDSLREGRHG